MHVYDLNDHNGVTDTEYLRENLAKMFPLEHESGIIASEFATVDRDEWAQDRDSITAELLDLADAAIAADEYAPAGDLNLGIEARADGAFIAVVMHDGERVCTLVGCDLDRIRAFDSV